MVIFLPPEVTFEKLPLSEGGWSYDFRHSMIGALGRILIQGLGGERATHISCEVAGDPADPRTAERRRIFEPIYLEVSRQMEQLTGAYQNSDLLPPAHQRKPTDVIETKLMQCPTCNGFAAMLIFAPDATDTGRFEDYARLMYKDYSRRDLPTWIIGPNLALKAGELAEIQPLHLVPTTYTDTHTDHVYNLRRTSIHKPIDRLIPLPQKRLLLLSS